MRKTGKLGAFARSSFRRLGLASLLSLALAAAPATVPTGRLPQAIIAYAFWGMQYDEFYEMVTAGATETGRDLKALQGTLDSLGCNVPNRMLSSHKAFVVPSPPMGQWIGFVWTGKFPPSEGTLFVTEPLGPAPGRVWVILSTVAPEHTTVFWVKGGDPGYSAGLVYDTFRKGKVSDEDRIIGAVTAVGIEKGDQILLKEWGPFGGRPPHVGEMGTVFQLDTVRSRVTLKSHGVLPQ